MDFTQSDIRGIVGSFVQNHSPEIEFFFGGYFALIKDTILSEGSKLYGFLVDHYGPSQIVGQFSDLEIKFTKEYTSSKNIIEYHFKKIDDMWVGKYTSKNKKIGSGKAIIKITPYTSTRHITIPEKFSPEGWLEESRNKRMENLGLLKVLFEDSSL